MTSETPPVNVGIFVYDQVEELDFVGPLETFHVAAHQASDVLGRQQPAFNVFTVAESTGILTTSGGLKVEPHHTFAEHPDIDVLVLPGGNAGAQSRRESVLTWLSG